MIIFEIRTNKTAVKYNIIKKLIEKKLCMILIHELRPEARLKSDKEK